MNSWELAGSSAKLLGLLAMAGVTGGVFSICLASRLRIPQGTRIRYYLGISAALGMLSVVIFFLTQIGGINRAGFAGMFDPTMASILIQSALGDWAGLRLLGFGGVVASCVWLTGKPGLMVLTACIVALGFSFSLVGHISTLTTVARFSITLHVLGACIWVGSLYPLLYLCRARPLPEVLRLMAFFGNCAVIVVATLLASGLFLAMQTVASFEGLVTTPYGRTLLLKLGGVLCLLGLAATNKLVLVPGLVRCNSASRLRLSIKTEILIALLVLAVTAWLTTAVGPDR